VTRTLERFDAARRADFDRIHAGGPCHCVAWWVPTWEGWGERTADENRALRDALCARGEYDGYLAYVDGAPAGWSQVGPRDRLAKVQGQFGLAPDAGTWAVSCFVIVPAHRRIGLASWMLGEILRDLPGRGARRVEAYPKRGVAEADDLWNGPEEMFRRAGFTVSRDHPVRPVLALDLV
jgi:GNAT superfamily N-acetyltransferase